MNDYRKLKYRIRTINSINKHTILAAIVDEKESTHYTELIKSYEAEKDENLKAKLKDKFIEAFNFNPDFALLSGDTDYISKKGLEEIIEEKPVKRATNGYSYTCFGNDGDKNKPIVIHEDIYSSWNCLMEYLKYPKYLVIIKVPQDETL